MDPLTHILIGAGSAQLLPLGRRGANASVLSWRQKACIGVIAALFPDIDYLLYLLSPLDFLAYWHRALTHSVLLAPLWAWILTLLWRMAPACAGQRLQVFYISLIGILSHILSDSLTIYGTRWFSPLSTYQVGWDLLFVFDIYFTLSIVMSLFLLVYWQHKPYRLYACVMPLGYLLLVLIIKLVILNRLPVTDNVRTAPPQTILAPQPFSPFYWQVIQAEGLAFKQAYIKLADDILANTLSQLFGLGFQYVSYRLPEDIKWHSQRLMPANPLWQEDAAQVWQHTEFKAFRDFTSTAVFYAYQQSSEQTCVWFSDLRYHWPGMQPAFRFGMCKDMGGTWQLYRIRYFSSVQKQKLP